MFVFIYLITSQYDFYRFEYVLNLIFSPDLFAESNDNVSGAPSRAEQKEWRNQSDTQSILAAGRQALLDVEQGIKSEAKPAPNWRDSVNEDKISINHMLRDMSVNQQQQQQQQQQRQLPSSRQKGNKSQQQQHQNQRQSSRERKKELEREVCMGSFAF